MTQVTSLESIQSQHQDLIHDLDQPTISNEALSQHRAHLPMFQKLVTMFDDVSSYVKTSLTGVSTPKGPINLSPITKAVQQVAFMDLKGFPVPVVPGQLVGFKPYFGTLTKSQDIVNKLYDYTLHPFEKFLAETLNDPIKLESNLHGLNVTEHNLVGIRKDLAAIVGRAGETMGYERVVSRHNEWEEIATLASNLVVAQKNAPVELITGTVQTIDTLISKVLSGIEDTNQQYRPSPNVIRELANLCYSLAEHVTFYSTHMTLLNMGLVALKRAEDTIVTALKS